MPPRPLPRVLTAGRAIILLVGGGDSSHEDTTSGTHHSGGVGEHRRQPGQFPPDGIDETAVPLRATVAIIMPWIPTEPERPPALDKRFDPLGNVGRHLVISEFEEGIEQPLWIGLMLPTESFKAFS